jgi:hypothetical protein
MEQPPKPIPAADPSLPKNILEAIGAAIEAYALVEGEQVFLLKSMMRSDMQTATIIFFSIQNSRSRCEMIGALLGYMFRGRLDNYWNSCSKFLGNLAKFRNAIAHWHPYVEIYRQDGTDKAYIKYVLGHPIPGKTFKTLTDQNVPPFVEDCQYIIARLRDLNDEVLQRSRRRGLPERFQQPLARQNQALLRTYQKPKTPKARRKSSRA